jgi:hypothetical protein
MTPEPCNNYPGAYSKYSVTGYLYTVSQTILNVTAEMAIDFINAV